MVAREDEDMEISYYGKRVLERLSLLVEKVQDFYKDRLYAIMVFGSLAKGEFKEVSPICYLKFAAVFEK